MPLLAWANFSTSLLVVIATPFIAASQFFVLLDRGLGFNFFNPSKGGDVLMYQHVFWFYSHPAVYIMMLPGFGIISEVLAVKARKPIFGYRMMAFSLLAIVVLGFTVWAHHMFVSGMQPWIRVPMMVTTAIIAVPTGIKIFSWLATLWRGVLHLDTPMLFALGFLTMFTLGGISGVMLAMIPLDIHVSDTYFIVAHIHYVLFGGSLMTIFAGVYYWFPKMTGRMLNETLGKVHFVMMFIGFNLTFFPQFIVGYLGMPRRYYAYAPEFQVLNVMSTAGASIMAVGYFLPLCYLIWSLKYGKIAGNNPWKATGLEWATTSPPPTHNFPKTPVVVHGAYCYDTNENQAGEPLQ
jgi:cytochrome c oxidase subunit 1